MVWSHKVCLLLCPNNDNNHDDCNCNLCSRSNSWYHIMKDASCLYMLFTFICGGELFSYLRRYVIMTITTIEGAKGRTSDKSLIQQNLKQTIRIFCWLFTTISLFGGLPSKWWQVSVYFVQISVILGIELLWGGRFFGGSQQNTLIIILMKMHI